VRESRALKIQASKTAWKKQGAIVYAGAAVSPVTGVIDYHKQPAVAASAPAVPTELPVARAIGPIANIPAPRNDARGTEKSVTDTRVVIIDPQTNAVVFRSLDGTTGAIIEQVPAQALLRRRAYESAQVVQALIKGKDPTAAEIEAEQNIDTTT
jgi:hypothetical protein